MKHKSPRTQPVVWRGGGDNFLDLLCVKDTTQRTKFQGNICTAESLRD